MSTSTEKPMLVSLNFPTSTPMLTKDLGFSTWALANSSQADRMTISTDQTLWTTWAPWAKEEITSELTRLHQTTWVAKIKASIIWEVVCQVALKAWETTSVPMRVWTKDFPISKTLETSVLWIKWERTRWIWLRAKCRWAQTRCRLTKTWERTRIKCAQAWARIRVWGKAATKTWVSSKARREIRVK